MITRTYLLGCCLAPLTRPGEIQVCLRDACRFSFACLLPGELAARGTLMTSNAASAVIAPRPPLPHSALERDSPPRLPVPHSALDRVSPRLPPFILTVCVSFLRFRRGPRFCLSAAEATGRRCEIRAQPRPQAVVTTSPGRVRARKFPRMGDTAPRAVA